MREHFFSTLKLTYEVYFNFSHLFKFWFERGVNQLKHILFETVKCSLRLYPLKEFAVMEERIVHAPVNRKVERCVHFRTRGGGGRKILH